MLFSTSRSSAPALMREYIAGSAASTEKLMVSACNSTSLRAAFSDSRVPLVLKITSAPHFNSFYPELTDAFQKRIRKAGYGMMLALHGENAHVFNELIDDMLAQNVAGLGITLPRFGDTEPVLARLRREHIPVVCITRYRAGSGLDTVATDNRQIGYRATRYLLEHGHRRILHIGVTDYSTGIDRASGYEQAMIEAGLTPHVIPIQDITLEANSTKEMFVQEAPIYSASKVVQDIWGNSTQSNLPTAVFCFNDSVAIGVYKALRQLEFHIPDDVSLISVDDLLMVRHFEVPLTTFRLPGESIGQLGAELLLRRLSGDASPLVHMLLEATLIERASVTPASS